VDGRDRILSLVAQRFPDADPIEKVLDWTFDLAQTRVFGIDNANALGIADFGEPEMFVLENILKGRSDRDITAEYSAANPGGEIKTAIDKIRGSVIFRPLTL
jgi:hypothetical protein